MADKQGIAARRAYQIAVQENRHDNTFPLYWLDPLLKGWFVLTAFSVAYVAWDAFSRNPELKVMKWGWLLVTLYGGPIMAAAYVLSCEEPSGQRHEDFVRPLWKQAFGSAIHRMAGDATGVIVAAAITTALGMPMWQDVLAEYIFGFGFGLLIFQALFMRDMGTVRALGRGGHDVTAEQRAEPMPGMAHGGMPGMPEMGAGPGATTPQTVAMTVLTILALCAGIIVATLFGRWAM